MSEVSNADVDENKKGGFSRRRVVAGVAWSVPVILTTVAAPPASASPGTTPPPTISAKLELVPGGTTLYKVGTSGTGNGNQRSGSCPSAMRITNTGSGLVTGTATGHIKITPQAGAPVGVGIEAMALAPFSKSGFGPGNVFEADFTYPNTNGISTSSPLDLALRFNYQATNVKATAYYDVDLLITFPSLPASLSVQAVGAVKVIFT